MQVLKADFRAAQGAKRFTDSLRETGFGVLTNHPIPSSLFQAVYDDWKKFFSSEEKFSYVFDKKTQAGYFPFKSENAKDYSVKDLKEFFHAFRDKKLPDSIGARTFELFDALFDVGQTLLQWIDDFSPEGIRASFSEPLKKMVKGSDQNLFRILHYPPLTGKEEAGAIRAAAHEDINLITLLPASTAMGLQVKDSQGNWYDVPGEWGDLVVNVGDMLQMASDRYYKSTTHRVVNPQGAEAGKPRYSMPLFLHPRPEVKLSSRMTAEQYLNERLREIGLK